MRVTQIILRHPILDHLGVPPLITMQELLINISKTFLSREKIPTV